MNSRWRAPIWPMFCNTVVTFSTEFWEKTGVFCCLKKMSQHRSQYLNSHSTQQSKRNCNSPFQGGHHGTNCYILQCFVSKQSNGVCINKNGVHTVLRAIVNVEDLGVGNPFRIQSERRILRNRPWRVHRTHLKCS